MGCSFPFLLREQVVLFIFTAKSLASGQPLPSAAPLKLCKGPLGRDREVGGFGLVVTHVTSLLVIFNPGTVFLPLEEEKETG